MDANRLADDDPLVEAARRHGLQPQEVAAIARRSEGRSCGDCTACCTVKSVRELGKPSQTRCQHICAAGCAIYEQRPASCGEYACLWRQGLIEGDERRRPDRLGVLIDYEPFSREPGTLRLVVWEIVTGMAHSEKVRYVVDKLIKAHKQIRAVAYCAAGQPAHHDFVVDRQTYPGIDPPVTLPIVAFDPIWGVPTYDFRKAG
jgi:hypothetical protein